MTTKCFQFLDTGICDICNSKEETRPYGPNGENVCFGCGMKNEQIVKERFLNLLESQNIAIVNFNKKEKE